MITLPKREENIYPKTEENIKALISFYFDKYDINQEGAIEAIMSKTSLSLNQVEFIIKKLSEAYPSIFRNYFSNGVILKNLFLMYGFSLTGVEQRGSRPAEKMKKEFIDFVENSQ